MKKSKAVEPDLTPEERRAIYEKVFGTCKHEKGFITNTGTDPSKCITCGRPYYQCQ